MFSVVIPLFNKAHTIERTLKSVLNQSFKDFEINIVNDGSTDNGIEVIKNLTDDARIHIIDQENQGVSVARNRGVSESKYNYIAFLDGDDEWHLDYLDIINKALQKHPESGMICCAGFFKNSETNKTSLRLVKKYKNKITKINYFENPHVYTHTSATVVTKKVFNKIGGFPIGMKKNEDFTLFFSIALIASTVYCGFPLSYYYCDVEGQATTVNQIDSSTSDLDVCKRFNTTYQLWNTLGRKNKLFKVFLKYELRHIFIASLRNKNFKKIDLFLKNIDTELLNLFIPLELSMYQKKKIVKISIAYILFSKIIWRMNGYPRVQ